MSELIVAQPTTSLPAVERDWAGWPWLDNEPDNLRTAEKQASQQFLPVCPACQEPAETLLDGLCLGCRMDWENHTIEQYQREEEDGWHDLQESLCGLD